MKNLSLPALALVGAALTSCDDPARGDGQAFPDSGVPTDSRTFRLPDDALPRPYRYGPDAQLPIQGSPDVGTPLSPNDTGVMDAAQATRDVAADVSSGADVRVSVADVSLSPDVETSVDFGGIPDGAEADVGSPDGAIDGAPDAADLCPVPPPNARVCVTFFGPEGYRIDNHLDAAISEVVVGHLSRNFNRLCFDCAQAGDVVLMNGPMFGGQVDDCIGFTTEPPVCIDSVANAGVPANAVAEHSSDRILCGPNQMLTIHLTGDCHNQ